MDLFKNRSFNVKVINDRLTATESSSESRDPAEGVLIAQAYAQIATETLQQVAQIAVTATVTVIAAKTAANIVNAGLKYLTK